MLRWAMRAIVKRASSLPLAVATGRRISTSGSVAKPASASRRCSAAASALLKAARCSPTWSAMRRDLDPIAEAEMLRFGFIREAQSRGAGQQHDPFRLILVVPETGWARLAERDNALYAQAGAGCERFGNFCGSGIG